MPFDGQGTFRRRFNFVNDKSNAIGIRDERMDTEMGDMATGLTNLVTRDGQSPATDNLPMASFRFTNISSATERAQYCTAGQLQDGGIIYGAAGGTANAITLTSTLGSGASTISSYVAGLTVVFKAASTNTDVTTLAIDSLGAKEIRVQSESGSLGLFAGQIVSGGLYMATYDGTYFQLAKRARLGGALVWINTGLADAFTVTYGNSRWVLDNTYVDNNIDGSGGSCVFTPTLSGQANTTTKFFGSGLFVSVLSITGGAAIYTSTDGINFTRRHLLSFTSSQFRDVAWSGATYVVVGSQTSNNPYIAISSDALAWSSISTPFAGDTIVRGIAYGNSTFVAVGSGTGSGIATSVNDGASFQLQNDPNLSAAWLSVAFGAGLFVAVNNATEVWTSPDGFVWTQRTHPLAVSAVRVRYVGGLFIMVSSVGANLGVSADGITWTSAVHNLGSVSVLDAAFGNDYYVVVGNGIAKSAYSDEAIDTAWNPNDKDSNISLTNNNKTAFMNSAGAGLVRALLGKSTGLWYYEVYIDDASTAGDNFRVGIATTAEPATNNVCTTAASWGYVQSAKKGNNSSFSVFGDSWTSGDVISVALNLTSGKVWFGKNGVWQGGGDPAADTNEAFASVSGTIYPAISPFLFSGDHRGTGRFRFSEFTGAIPTGFSPWADPG